ncbi:CPBP family intramembrane metalloprotease [Paracrocinitomix mangrovi]|uniref:CPBP family intramembrane glutamic endopeptidase n=1 Tax=Paracrocinitomix mangrovi TaxID=2862509 RepID=UPI001C8ED091|nr:CPBP family intramembrane glutamic endopeptidase [Paracrocinitomix mangrovi]UKN02127.1 CPBP family intramembrane metalloprotease [Paracrocinitomix mangrovi]
MRTFVFYILDFLKEEFSNNKTAVKKHAIIAIFLAIALTFNYSYSNGEHNTFYDAMVHVDYKSFTAYLLIILFYGFSFFSAVSIISTIEKDKTLWNKNYLIFALIGIAFLSLDSSYIFMHISNEFFGSNIPPLNNWINACLSNLSSTFTIIIPLYILYFVSPHFKPEFLGFKLNGAKIKPYLWLILLMIPLIIAASFLPDFLDHYPTYKDRHEYDFIALSQWQTTLIYEFCYGFDFISVELFFRGFLVVALTKIVGRKAILPMVVIYCFLHFGKPMGEAISSIFGGYILGILAYKSRNIFGGLIVHLGVAWGMELMAYLQQAANHS